MERIVTASSLLIETQPESWRLLLNGTGERTLLEARRGEPIRYAEVFGTRRKLPLAGQLDPQHVDRVVLGWSPNDEAWHLGLVLRPPLSDERGSRWCELAHWIDPERDQYQNAAVSVGEALSTQIDRPFILIPPAPAAEPPPPPPLPALPLRFDLWTFRQSAEGQYEFVRAGKWARSNILRALWYLLWVAAFLVLSITSVTSGIAYPTPRLLVPAGFVCAFVLFVAAVALIVRAFLRPNRIVIGDDAITWRRGGAVTKTIPLSDVSSVYVSHILGRARRVDGVKRGEAVYGELNLELKDGAFQVLLTHGNMNETLTGGADAVEPLTAYTRQTALQAVGLILAERLRVPVYNDLRGR
jgi:hypothetical protein